MTRVKLNTTVDEALLTEARALRIGVDDSVVLDEALRAFVAANRRAKIDVSYAAYEDQPIDSSDEWGNLATWGRAARRKFPR